VSSYYDLLGVPPNATEMEIRSAYGRDVLRLQEAPNAKTAEFRTTLDAALATLTDPTKRAEYDAALAAYVQDAAAVSVDESDQAFTAARNGGIAFAAGGLITAASYAFSDGTYLLAWGPLIFGGIALAVGLVKYLRVPAGRRRPVHLMLLGGLVAAGVLSAGFVAVSEGIGSQEAGARSDWNAMIDSTNKKIEQADALVGGVASHSAWLPQDAVDMEQASRLYADVAEQVSRATAPSRLDWYRVAMAQNFRDAASITHEYAMLTPSSSPGAFNTLSARWDARINDFNKLSDRFEAEEGKKR
jgi:hypothetical protein